MIRLRKNVLFVILMTILALFLFNCEGPAGEDGTDGVDGSNGTAGVNGVDGVDGNVTCLVCHADENLQMKRHEFAISQHAVGDIAVGYAGGRAGCAACHSHEGFVAFTEGFTAHNISNPSPWECGTCHGLHQTFEAEDYALRTTDAPAIWDGGNFLLKGTNYLDVQGNSNLCANCHQSRRAEPNITNPGATFNITSTHYGPHHGAQANVLAGVGFAEIAGSIAYPTAGSANHITASCTGCHMYEGDHGFNPSLLACNTCHGATDTDFNYGGVADEMADLLEELRDLLIAKGVIEEGIEDLFELDEETGDIVQVQLSEGYHPVVGEHPMVLAQAFFNWVGLAEDRSLGAHNPKYYKALLKNSIDAVNAL